jgi:hypothetical protein
MTTLCKSLLNFKYHSLTLRKRKDFGNTEMHVVGIAKVTACAFYQEPCLKETREVK